LPLQHLHSLEDKHVPVVHLPGHHLLLPHDVATVLADGGQDDAGDPPLELTGFRFVRAHDELVETAFADDQWLPCKRQVLGCPHFLVRTKRREDVRHGRRDVLELERIGDVSRYEPRLPVDLDDADVVGVENVNPTGTT